MTGSGSRFDDGKAEGALRTIGEVSEAFGIKSHVLRYWEQQFPMLRPLKRAGGRRYYRPEDVVLVERIDRLVNREGYTLKGARAVVESEPQASAGPSGEAEAKQALPSDLVPRLRSLRSRLAAALEA